MKLKNRLKNNARKRRIGVLERLNEQLTSGMKPQTRKREKAQMLSESDISRINREINILKQRI